MAKHSTMTQTNLKEILDGQREMIRQITVSQKTIVKSQNDLARTVAALAESIAVLARTPPTVSPIVNIPAPIVNVMTENGRRMVTTKTIERDDNGLISKVTENVDEEENA